MSIILPYRVVLELYLLDYSVRIHVFDLHIGINVCY